jgi:hypothetical protein
MTMKSRGNEEERGTIGEVGNKEEGGMRGEVGNEMQMGRGRGDMIMTMRGAGYAPHNHTISLLTP